MRKLIFDNNLAAMQSLQTRSVDAVLTDPPFGSGRNYMPDDSDSVAFTDKWRYNDVARAEYWELKVARKTSQYEPVVRFLDSFATMHNDPVTGVLGKLRAYLTFMAPRIVEIHRVLKDTGTFYLHCDSTCVHYLKAMCDVVFGAKHFHNDLIWHYTNKMPSSIKRQWTRATDTILFYSKTNDYTFNTQYVKREKPRKFQKIKSVDGVRQPVKDEYGRIEYGMYEERIVDNVFEIPIITSGNDRSGYPTQKPVQLYHMLVLASSNEDDVVLDPFCGSGTTIIAAERYKRNWIGIDINPESATHIRNRLHYHFFLNPFKDYDVDGDETLVQKATDLLNEELSGQQSLFGE